MKEFVDFVALIIIYFLRFYKKWKSKGRYTLLVNTAMYIYLSFILYFTLMPIIVSIPFIFNHPYKPMNLVPFIDVLMGRGDFIRQIVLNIIMTFPFGFMLPLIKKENAKLTNIIFYTLFLSLTIELLQPLINGFRSADITDIITNLMGGILGYITHLICKPIINKILAYTKSNPKKII